MIPFTKTAILVGAQNSPVCQVDTTHTQCAGCQLGS